MRIGYLECFSGISGDMFLGALVDAGVPLPVLEEATAALKVGARLRASRVMRGGIAATKVDVLTGDTTAETAHTRGHADGHEHSHSDEHEHSHAHAHEHSHGHAEETHTHEVEHRSLSTILGVIAAAALSDGVKTRATRAFQLLGEAEAAIHAIPVEKVHFHEVGAVDTVVDLVCAAAGAEALGVEQWLAAPLNVGSGTVKCAHGTLPVPAPATLALLGDAPVYAAGEPMERVTPTRAAILRMLEVRYEALPAMRVQVAGYGAGGRDTRGNPNVLRLLVGEAGDDARAEQIAVMETVIDDSTPQLLAYVSERLLEAGAWDVLRAAVQMKKGRTGVQLTVLCKPELVPAMRDLIFRETTTLGLHWRVERKESLTREFVEVRTEWGAVRMKIARVVSGEVANAAPEYEDCRALAMQHRVPLKRVMQAAMRAWAEMEKGARR
ncbi:MAG: nickel pincer cofactor biosynthesis protein LarC [Terracidiphilus sp.]